MTQDAKLVQGQHSANAGDVLKAVNDLSAKTCRRFDEVFEVVSFIKDNAVMRDEFNDEISGIGSEVSGIKSEVSGIKSEVSSVKSQIMSIKSSMVTKDYLDDKMSDLRGDLVVMMRKEDSKLKTLVGVLKEKSVLDSSDVKRIYSMEPFAQ